MSLFCHLNLAAALVAAALGLAEGDPATAGEHGAGTMPLTLEFETKIFPLDAPFEARMGESIDVEGGVLVTGASSDDAGAEFAGSAYVFMRDPGEAEPWIQVRKLTAPNPGIQNFFGQDVAISGDTIVVSAHFVSAVYVFERNAGGPDNWGFVRQIDGIPGTRFGTSIDLEGDTLVVGAPQDSQLGSRAGAAFVHERDEGGADNWGQVQKIFGSDTQAEDFFGLGVAIGAGRIAVGADVSPGQGKAYIFEYDSVEDEWSQVTQVAPSGVGEVFAQAISLDGDTLVVGDQLEPVNGNNQAGAAFVFERNEGGMDTWGEVAMLVASDGESNDRFGFSVDVKGNRLAVGAVEVAVEENDEGAVYLFERDDNGNWLERDRALGMEQSASLGSSVAVDGNAVVAGALGNSEVNQLAGAVHTYLLGPELFTLGDCPGSTTIGLAGGTPNELAGLIWALAPGTFPVPGGVCAGLELGLDQPNVLNALPADEDGEVRFDITAPGGICGLSIQAVDLATCEASNVTTVAGD